MAAERGHAVTIKSVELERLIFFEVPLEIIEDAAQFTAWARVAARV